MWAGHQVCSVPGTDETAIDWALQGLATHGHATESAWPYGRPTFRSGRPNAAREEANRRPLPVWRQLADCSTSVVAGELDNSLAVVIGLQIVLSAWQQPSNGLIDADAGRKVAGGACGAVRRNCNWAARDHHQELLGPELG